VVGSSLEPHVEQGVELIFLPIQGHSKHQHIQANCMVIIRAKWKRSSKAICTIAIQVL
jgi:hypothetical protein